jgi:hypothetical protein
LTSVAGEPLLQLEQSSSASSGDESGGKAVGGAAEGVVIDRRHWAAGLFALRLRSRYAQDERRGRGALARTLR